jgi:hypothetical protein
MPFSVREGTYEKINVHCGFKNILNFWNVWVFYVFTQFLVTAAV